MTLHLYVMRRYLVLFAVVAGVFGGLALVVETESALRTHARAGMADALGMALLRVPATLYEVLPVVALLAALGLALRLARSSELVIIRASGRSATTTLLAPALVAAVLGVVAVALLNPVSIIAQRAFEARSAMLGGSVPQDLSISAEGLWLRQAGGSGQTVIHARRASTDATRLEQVSVHELSPDGRILMRHEAARAELVTGAWALIDGKSWQLEDGGGPAELGARRFSALRLETDLTANAIREGVGAPGRVSVWGLSAHVERLDRAGFSTLPHRVHLQQQLAMPLLLAAMALLGASLLTRPARMGRTGVMALAAMVVGLGVYFLRNFAGILGRAGDVPLVLAAWSLPVAALLVALSVLLHAEEGG